MENTAIITEEGRAAYFEGKEAFDREYFITDNPFKGRDFDMAMCWLRGYAEAAAAELAIAEAIRKDLARAEGMAA